MAFWIVMAAGLIAMFAVMAAVRKIYSVSLWKTAVMDIVLIIAGYFGAKLMYVVENGQWVEKGSSGVSLYGSIFLCPAVMALLALLLKIKVSYVLDMIAPAECVILALLKVRCFIDGCCGGRVLFTTAAGKPVVFPSQIVECVLFVLIMAFLLVLIVKKEALRGLIHPVFLVVYGFLRFFLTLLREFPGYIFGKIPNGCLWSVIAFIAGGIWLAAAFKKRRKAQKA